MECTDIAQEAVSLRQCSQGGAATAATLEDFPSLSRKAVQGGANRTMQMGHVLRDAKVDITASKYS
jgi:hypothetical protein